MIDIRTQHALSELIARREHALDRMLSRKQTILYADEEFRRLAREFAEASDALFSAERAQESRSN